MEMPLAPLQAVDLGITLTTGAVYAYVGSRLSRRRVEGDARLAWLLFTNWWFAVAALTLLGGATRLLRAAGVHDEPLHLTALYVTLLLLCYALWALLYYLLYLFTGSRRALVPVTIFYLGTFTFLTYAVTAGGPYFDPSAGAILYERPIPPRLAATILVFLVAPHVFGALGYFLLFFRARGPTQRYRIGLVAWSIIVWFSVILMGHYPLGGGRLADLEWWPLATRAVGLLAAMAILLAYRPPAWIRARLRVEAVDERPRAQ